MEKERSSKMRKTHWFLACLMAVTFLFVSIAPVLAEDHTGLININTATIDELTQLKRIGPSFAQRIVEYREQYGPFKAPEDIVLVKGIGQRTWEENKNLITIGN